MFGDGELSDRGALMGTERNLIEYSLLQFCPVRSLSVVCVFSVVVIVFDTLEVNSGSINSKLLQG